ncbi:FAD-dependent monooxygenase [Nocardia sp. NPDC023852]|uniref:FAD-dependent monooxygenase n=1 Tax=Nocardia sp. NPDC023852 TaxID=3154697 RepID=UPI0034047EA8
MSSSSSPRRVLVVGAGVGGLTLAIALARRGVTVEVVDINPGRNVAGWGLSLTGPSLRALDVLALADECIAAGYGITAISNCGSNGEVRNVIPLPPLLGPKRPSQIGLGRPALYDILCEAALAAGVVISYGRTIDGLHDNGEIVRATVSDGSERFADVVVGADGVHSRVRSLLGIHGSSRYIGQMVWRALVPRPGWATSLHTFAGTGNNAGLVPIADDRAYVFLTENQAEPSPIPEDTLADGMRRLLAPFGGRVAEVRDLITDSALVVRRPVQVVMVEGPWHRGRTVIIGDAAHAPSPQLVSGAALAIEDGVLLAEELAAAANVEKALVAFTQRRLERCRLVVESSVRIADLGRTGRHAEADDVQQRCHRSMAAPA